MDVDLSDSDLSRLTTMLTNAGAAFERSYGPGGHRIIEIAGACLEFDQPGQLVHVGRATLQSSEVRMSIRPLQDRVIVKRLDGEETSPGGIIIPDAAKEKPAEGEVVATGNGRVLEDGHVRPLDVKPGDRVLFAKFAGTEITVDGQELLMMREEDVLAVVER